MVCGTPETDNSKKLRALPTFDCRSIIVTMKEVSNGPGAKTTSAPKSLALTLFPTKPYSDASAI